MPAEMASLIDLGVDGLITDYPDRALPVLADKGPENPLRRLTLRRSVFCIQNHAPIPARTRPSANASTTPFSTPSAPAS
mgnify:CR=1 FL=1